MSTFPKDFWWGSATAAYQVEGAATEGGRGPSIWDTFAHTSGKVVNGETGDVACDHYHRWRADVDLMASLGLHAYRFSVSWPRVIPQGVGKVNEEGLQFYSDLVDALVAAGIRPILTLYHWDLPQPLQDRGGWANRETAYAFADYARVVARALGDRVAVWTSLNEPWCSAFLGHASGVHAPGITDPAIALTAAHHLNLAHGLASQVIREELSDAQISISLNLHMTRPADPACEADVAAAKKIGLVGNEIFLGPIMDGVLAPELTEATSGLTDWSFVHDGDLALCNQRPDLLGINYYSTNTVRTRQTEDLVSSGGHGSAVVSPWPSCDDVTFLPPTGSLTAMGWNIDPAGMTDLLTWVGKRWAATPLIVTENGAAYNDVVDATGTVHDPERIDYLRRHIRAVGDAIEQGIDVRGYCLWSLMDNFEWAWGYSKRFGIVRVDYPSGERTVKDSGRWYAGVVATNGSKLDG